MPRLRLASTLGWGFPSWNEDEEAQLLLSFGIKRVQIFRDFERHIPADLIRRKLAGHGLAATSLHCRFGDAMEPSRPDPAARRQAVRDILAEADYCQELGGRLLIVHPGNQLIGAEARSPARIEALRRSAEELAAAAEKKGLVLALENLQPGQMGDDMGILRQIVDAVDSPNLGLNYDCGHANLTGDPVTILETAGPRLVGTHIHDNHGQTDDHIVPGDGNIDLDAVCRTLAGIGYQGDFTLELMESSESVRLKCDAAWRQKLDRWLDLAGGGEA